MKSVSEKVQCQKLTNIILKILRDVFENTYNFVEERTVKQSSYNYENLKPKYCFKHKKENMVNVK